MHSKRAHSIKTFLKCQNYNKPLFTFYYIYKYKTVSNQLNTFNITFAKRFPFLGTVLHTCYRHCRILGPRLIYDGLSPQRKDIRSDRN